MKKVLMLFIFALLLLPSIFALNIKVDKVSQDEVMIAELDKAVTFNFKITNFEGETNLEFFNLIGFLMTPAEKIKFEPGEVKEIAVTITPIDKFNYLGTYTFNYFIRDQTGAQMENILTFRRVELKDAFEIGAGSFNPDSSSIELYLKNKLNFDFDDVEAKFSSEFFNFNEKFDLKANERKIFEVILNKDDFKELLAGFYTTNAEIIIEETITPLETTLEFTEKSNIRTEEESYGFIINTKKINKINEGNLVENSQIKIEKNIFSRLFTTFNINPDFVERDGFKITYTWIKSLNPGETFGISVKTNWIFPLLLILIVVGVVISVKIYSTGNVVLKKRISFVRAKGSEFALKITVKVHAKKRVESVSIIERLPLMVKLFGQYGSNHPSRVDEKARRIDWNFDKLDAGEVRILTYIVYSKVGVMGKFSLPPASAIYEKEGKIHETKSNRAFFVSEPRGTDVEED